MKLFVVRMGMGDLHHCKAPTKLDPRQVAENAASVLQGLRRRATSDVRDSVTEGRARPNHTAHIVLSVSSPGVAHERDDVRSDFDIEAELRWDPKVNAAQIGVTVDKGAVSVLGTVDSYAEKWAAEDAIKRVSGVRTVAQDLTVKLLTDHKRTDQDIAAATQNMLTWDVFVPSSVTAKVSKSRVTLEGEVTWNYQREAADRAIRHLAGVEAVFNAITLKPHASADQVKEKVEAALHRQAKTDSKSIHIDTTGGRVTLSGHASSWQSVEDATNAAWAVRSVTEVVDHLKVEMTTN